MGVLAISYWHTRRLHLFAGVATTVAVVEVIGTVITRNPNVYLAASAINNVLYGLIFLGLFLFGHLPWSLSAGSFNDYWVNTNKVLAL